MKEDINALDELNKGALMGAYSINYILEKVLIRLSSFRYLIII